jgi:acetyltransferase EpsM
MGRKELILFGAGGHASKLIEIIHLNQTFQMDGYISTEKKGTIKNDYPVLGNLDDYKKSEALKNKYFHIAIGDNSVRYQIHEAIDFDTSNLVPLISVYSTVSPDAVVGKGTAVSHRAVIGNNSKVGMCCIVDTGAVLDHDTEIQNFVNISPGSVLCGGVKIGFGAVVGAGTTIIEKITIGENSLIGAGSVVIEDIAPNVVAAGNPAKVIKKRNFGEKYLK